jgi:hypothetical protein
LLFHCLTSPPLLVGSGLGGKDVSPELLAAAALCCLHFGQASLYRLALQALGFSFPFCMGDLVPQLQP